LYRLETDHGKQLVQDTCSFICVSRNGLLDIELRSIVTVDDYKWSGFLRALSAFIKAAGDSGELTFFHQQFHAAVLKRYFNNPKLIIKYHTRLSEFFHHRVKNLLREFKHFLLANANILQNNFALTFQQAANQPGYTEPAKRAQIRWNEHWERRPWIQWINKPEESDACKQTYSGFQDGITACTYSRDGPTIAIAGRDCLIRTLNAQTGTEILPFRTFELDGNSPIFSGWCSTRVRFLG